MRTGTALGMIFLLGSLGCGYHMHVYSEIRGPVEPGASMFVTPSPQSNDVAIEEAATDRVAMILEEKGFGLATAESAQYHLFFDYITKKGAAGLTGWPIIDLTPEPPSMIRIEDPTSSQAVPTGPDNTPAGTPGHMAATPSIPDPGMSSTVWVHYVTVQVVDADDIGGKGVLRPVWAGWAQWDKTLVDQPRDRAALLDALLMAAFSRFPGQTGAIVRLAIRPDAGAR